MLLTATSVRTVVSLNICVYMYIYIYIYIHIECRIRQTRGVGIGFGASQGRAARAGTERALAAAQLRAFCGSPPVTGLDSRWRLLRGSDAHLLLGRKVRKGRGDRPGSGMDAGKVRRTALCRLCGCSL